jgi:NADH:ubiquinone oxidoreductase subunit 4 (subunit M)
MHNRVGPKARSSEIDGLHLAAIAPLVAVIVALGVYPNFVVERTERSTVDKIQAARALSTQAEVSVIK